MLLASDWEKLHQKKLNWAYDARENLLKDLKSHDLFYFEDNIAESEMMISVYGKSQRGKTTCILSLLGIKGEEILTVSDILRGSRKRGTSATSTATAYKRSASDNYAIAYGDIFLQELAPDEFKKRMDEIRHEIESKPGSIDQITVFIPDKYFDESAPLHKFRIVDLPGVESAEEKEKEHVEELVERYFKSSDSVLIVELANSLTDLGQISFAKQGLEIWSRRFKVILTRSLSLESVKNMILGKCEDEIYESLLAYYQAEVNRSLFGKIQDNIEIFPMEFGESLLEFTATYPRHKEAIYGVLNRMRNDLLNSISETLTMEDKLMESVNMANTIKKRAEDKKREKEQFLNDVEKKLKRVETYSSIDGGIRLQKELYEKKLSVSQKLYRVLSDTTYPIASTENNSEPFLIYLHDKTKIGISMNNDSNSENRSILKKEVDLAQINMDLINSREQIRNAVKSSIYDQILEPILAVGNTTCEKLVKDYEKKNFLNEEMDLYEVDEILDSLFFTHFFRKKLKQDALELIMNSLKVYRERYTNSKYNEIPRLIERIKKVILKNNNELEQNIYDIEMDLRMKIKNLERLRSLKSAKEQEYEQIINQYEADAKVVVKFQEYLDASFRNEYNQVIKEMNGENEGVWNLFYLKLITEKHQYFTNKLENKYGKEIG